MIREYRVVQAKDLDLLVSEVDRFILVGWVPIGGIAVCPSGDGRRHYQAMTRQTADETATTEETESNDPAKDHNRRRTKA